MAAPTVTPATSDAYDRLPEAYRDADEDQAYPLLRYLSLLLDQLAPVGILLARLTYTPEDDPEQLATVGGLTRLDPPQRYGSGTYGDVDTYGDADTSDLVDPAHADAGWLPWLAQLVGVPVTGTTDELRDAIAHPDRSWAHGTHTSIERAAAGALTGSRYVDVLPHYGGDPYTIGLVTIREETPASDTFGTLKAVAPTWGDLARLGSFAGAAAPAVAHAAELERPAGYRLTHVYADEV